MEIFWNTIAAYNAATWPAQIVFTGIATLLLLLLCLRPTNTVRIAMKSFMAMLNFWIAGVYYMTFYMIAFGFSLGAQIIMGRRNGEGNYAKIGPIFYNGTYFLLGVALVLFVSSHFVSPLILERFIDSPHVHEAAVSYIRWRVYGFFFSFVAVISWEQPKQRL